LQTVLDGEKVKRVYPHLGYIHRGIEKMWEGMTYPQTLALTDRLNYLSAMMHRHALVGVIEEGMGIELSDRIHYIRTIMDELQRIDSHLLYLGCTAQDLGALTAFLYCMRDREHVLNVMEETTGGRLIQNYYRIGGLQADIDPKFVENTKKLCKYLRPMIQEYLDVFGDNVITHNRLVGVGPMGLEDCINYGVTGPAGRAAGWKNDTRKRHPYDLYDKVEWEEITMTGCDSMDRYYCHIKELYQSLNIIEQLIDNIPEGDFYIKQKPIIKVPEGQWYFSVEGASGEFGVYLDSKGDKSPYRMKMRPMGLTLTGALDPMLRGQVFLLPFQCSFPPCISKAKYQYQHKEAYARKRHGSKLLDNHCPGVEEECLNVEHQEKDSKEVVAHVYWNPRGSTRRNTTLKRLTLNRVVRTRTYELCNYVCTYHQYNSRQDDCD
jgi:NADH-quinone oxidoreductase subunit C/D